MFYLLPSNHIELDWSLGDTYVRLYGCENLVYECYELCVFCTLRVASNSRFITGDILYCLMTHGDVNHLMVTIGSRTRDFSIASPTLNGLICLHSVLDKAGSQSVFKRT